MEFEDCLTVARTELQNALSQIQDELRDYPTPVSGCDAQYNYLLGLRASVKNALDQLAAPRFVATPRVPEAGARVESR